MSNQSSKTLEDAFALIEEGKLSEARELVAPLLETDASNPAVWWIYAHAVEDSEEGIRAVEKVTELDPTYPGVAELKSEISAINEQDTIDTFDDFDDVPFEIEEPQTPSSTRQGNRLLLLAGIIIVVIIVLLGVLFALSGINTGTADPTDVASQPTNVSTTDAQIVTSVNTEEPTTDTIVASETPEPTNTVEMEPTETSSPTHIDLIASELSDLNVATTDITTVTTTIGETLIVDVCALPGAESSIRLNRVMNTYVDQESSLPDDIEAVAVRLINCDNEDSIPRTIGVEREFVTSLASEEIELKDFQREWQPLQ